MIQLRPLHLASIASVLSLIACGSGGAGLDSLTEDPGSSPVEPHSASEGPAVPDDALQAPLPQGSAATTATAVTTVAQGSVAPTSATPTAPPGTPVADLGSGADPGEPNIVAAPAATAAAAPAVANTNVSLGGSQDFGYFRRQLAEGIVPAPDTFDAAGFFAEHHTQLPTPDCGDNVCLQAMLGVMGNLLDGSNCTMLQLGFNSPIAADPGNRPPLTLAVVVDTSGSMQAAGKIDFVKEGLDILIDGLRDEDRFTLVSYSSGAVIDVPMTGVKDHRVDIRTAVDELEATGGTNFYAGLEAGYRELLADYDSARQNRVILLSDGVPTEGDTDIDSIVAMSRGYNSDGIGLTTIGLGTDFNYDLMRDLALQADGNFYFLENAGAVSEVFDEELSFFTVPIAFDLKLRVQSGADYEFGRAVGSPLWENKDQGGVLEVPSVFVAHRESADDVTVDGGRRGGGSALLIELMPRLRATDSEVQDSADVAIIDVEFRQPGSNDIVTDQIVVNYPNAPWETPEQGYFSNVNSDSSDLSVVTKSFVMLNVYVGIEKAVAAFHENATDPSLAVAELQALIAALIDYNDEVQDTDIEYDIELVQDLSQVMQDNSVILDPTLVDIPLDPWPAD